MSMVCYPLYKKKETRNTQMPRKCRKDDPETREIDGKGWKRKNGVGVAWMRKE